MKCKECGHEFGGDAKFCPECGKSVRIDNGERRDDDGESGILGGLGEILKILNGVM